MVVLNSKPEKTFVLINFCFCSRCEESSVTFPIDKSAEIYIYIQEIEIGGVEQRNRWELNFTVRAKS